MAGTNNYIPDYTWHVITCPCLDTCVWHTCPQMENGLIQDCTIMVCYTFAEWHATMQAHCKLVDTKYRGVYWMEWPLRTATATHRIHIGHLSLAIAALFIIKCTRSYRTTTTSKEAVIHRPYHLRNRLYRIMNILEWRAVYALTRGLFWCLFPGLES